MSELWLNSNGELIIENDELILCDDCPCDVGTGSYFAHDCCGCEVVSNKYLIEVGGTITKKTGNPDCTEAECDSILREYTVYANESVTGVSTAGTNFPNCWWATQSEVFTCREDTAGVEAFVGLSVKLAGLGGEAAPVLGGRKYWEVTIALMGRGGSGYNRARFVASCVDEDLIEGTEYFSCLGTTEFSFFQTVPFPSCLFNNVTVTVSALGPA